MKEITVHGTIPPELAAFICSTVHPNWTGPVPQPWADFEPGDYLQAPKIFADGRTAWCLPTFFGGRIAISEHPLAIGFYDLWCYNSLGSLSESRLVCVRAFVEWNGDGEPSGWMRHPATGRYRTNGDPLREYVEGSAEWARGGR